MKKTSLIFVLIFWLSGCAVPSPITGPACAFDQDNWWFCPSSKEVPESYKDACLTLEEVSIGRSRYAVIMIFEGDVVTYQNDAFAAQFKIGESYLLRITPYRRSRGEFHSDHPIPCAKK
jgi:hypothetical protein